MQKESDNLPNPTAPQNKHGQGAGMAMDASYSFGFNEGGFQREESSDPLGNVRGHYSYINAEGNEIEVLYSAAAETGFVIENEVELSKTIDKATNEAYSAALDNKELSASSVIDVRHNYNSGATRQQTKPLDKGYGYLLSVYI